MHVEIEEAGDVEELRGLWLALRDHHGEVTGRPVHDDDVSWARRRADYEKWLAAPDAFALVARDDDGRPIGYAMVAVHEEGATFEGGRLAEVETLSVDAERRGEGIGHALLEAVAARLDTLHITQRYITYIVGNDGAARFYAREGCEPAYVTVRWPAQRPQP